MANRVSFIRYAGAALANIVGKESELIINLSTRAVTVHDGATPGGFEQARADMTNVLDATSAAAGRMSTAHVDDLAGVIVALAAEIVDRVAADATKADKITPSEVNNVALLDASGNLVDSGKSGVEIGFAAGTKMVFAQSSAPTGWTQDATGDRMLRVVAGAGGSVGGVTSPISHTHTTGDVTLSAAQMPAHAHQVSPRVNAGSAADKFHSTFVTTSDWNIAVNVTGAVTGNAGTSNAGGGAAHNHGSTSNNQPKYVDVIFAAKD